VEVGTLELEVLKLVVMDSCGACGDCVSLVLWNSQFWKMKKKKAQCTSKSCSRVIKNEINSNCWI
jgi:hypothetical protein